MGDTSTPVRESVTSPQTASARLSPEVFYTDDSGKQVDFRAPADPKQKPPSGGETRIMDCVDCHNRPTHTFQLPDAAVDQALSDGRISPDLPFVKKEAVKALKVSYPNRDTAAKEIAADLEDFYRASYPGVYREKRHCRRCRCRSSTGDLSPEHFPGNECRLGHLSQ